MSGNPTDRSLQPSSRRPSTRLAVRHEGAVPVPPPHALAARERLLLAVRGGAFDVLEAALLVAAEEYPGLDIAEETHRIDVLGAEAARRVAAVTNPFARIDAFREFLFDEMGFRGNQEAYDEPANSFMNQVLERRLGIPLTLSILYIEVGRRAGLDVRGVALPGHFVVRVAEQGRTVFVDPFHGGVVITEEDCRDLVVRTTGRASLFRRDTLQGSTPIQMLSRLLLNLKRIHLARGDYAHSLAAVERLLLVSPDDARELRDRGLLLAHMGRPGAAVAALENYLERVPRAADANSVRGRMAWLLRKMSEDN